MSHAIRNTLVAAAVALLSAAILVALALPAHAAGKAEVHFVEPDRFSDAGRSSVDRDRTLESLSAHLQALARRLPDSQVLKIDVLDVDLAGEMRWRHGGEVRVLRGAADVPLIQLRWSLEEAGRKLRGGEQRLSDLGYMTGGRLPAQAAGEDLPYEKRMLTRWFSEQVETGR